MLHPARAPFVQLALVLPAVEVAHPERAQRGAHPLHHQRHRRLPQLRRLQCRGPRTVSGWRPALGQLTDVLPLVAILRHLPALRQREDRLAQLGHLRARVVDVELARHLVPVQRQQPRQRVPVRRVARVAHVHRPRRVGAHELDQHPLAALARHPPRSSRRPAASPPAPASASDRRGTGSRSPAPPPRSARDPPPPAPPAPPPGARPPRAVGRPASGPAAARRWSSSRRSSPSGGARASPRRARGHPRRPPVPPPPRAPPRAGRPAACASAQIGGLAEVGHLWDSHRMHDSRDRSAGKPVHGCISIVVGLARKDLMRAVELLEQNHPRELVGQRHRAQRQAVVHPLAAAARRRGPRSQTPRRCPPGGAPPGRR